MRAQQKQPQPSEDDIRELLELAQIPYTHAARAAAQFALAEAVANYEEENVGHRWPSRKMWLDVETAAQRLLEAMHGLNDFYGPGDIGWWWEGTTKAKKRAAMMAAEAEGLFPGYLDPSEAKAYGLNPTTKGMAEAMDLLRDMQRAAKESSRLRPRRGNPYRGGDNLVVFCAALFLARYSPTVSFSQTPTGAFGKFAKKFFEAATGAALSGSALDAQIREVGGRDPHTFHEANRDADEFYQQEGGGPPKI